MAAVLLMLCPWGILMAQTVAVKGKVTDSGGEPLVAVTVYENGNTSNGTATDSAGNYSISVPSGATLVFSCLGFEDVKVIVGKKTDINVTLEEDKLTLEASEVVSIGYGSVTRRDLTGSVSKVDMEDIVKAPVTNFDQALQGRVAGVVVTTSDGALGAEANITIRGNNSLTQSSAPLYVIDGFQSESSMATSLNPNDIESIDILKDASATAIYGARGANGVIVITTKQGVEGKPKVSFSASWAGSSVQNRVEMMDAQEFIDFQTEFCDYYGLTNFYLRYNDRSEYDGIAGVDWQDVIYRTAFTQNYNVSLSGGSKETGTRYNVSLSATDQDGVIDYSNFQRYQGKINFSQKIGKHVTFDINANYSRSVTQGSDPKTATSTSSASGWLMYSVWGYRPVKPLYQLKDGQTMLDAMMSSMIDDEEGGGSSANDYRFNPAYSIKNEIRKRTVDYLNANAALRINILPELVLRITGGYTLNKQTNEQFNGSQTYTGYEGSPSGRGINGAIHYNTYMNWQQENTLTWTKHIRNRHHIELLGGFTLSGQNSSYQGIMSNNMTTEALGLNGLHTGNYQAVTPWERNWTQMSGLFRANYNYKYRYYITASFRADGSSKFPVDNRWGYFPSVGLSWNFNREPWLKSADWISNGKLRFSWGMTGNNRTTTPYDFYAQITTIPGNRNSVDYVFGGTHVAGYEPSNMANDDLKWETTEQYNLGVDFSVFDSRIGITADIYLKNTYDLLLQAVQPASSGYTSAMMNIGSMQNKGIELTLNAVPVRTRKFEWNLNLNFAMNRNKVTALTDDQYSLFSIVTWDQKFNSQQAYVTQVGKPTGMMYGYVYEGTYKPGDFNGTSLKDGVPYMTSVGQTSVRPGDPKYKDINRDGVVDANDQTVIGSGQPVHTGGFNNTFTFYGFDVNVFFQWSYGNDVLNASRLIFENGTITSLNQFRSYTDRFNLQSNPDSDIPRVGANAMSYYSSRVVEDASFLRLKNVSIGYTLPRRVLRKIHFDTVRIYVSADNLWTWTRYSGPDPEVSTKNSVLTPGFDWSAYPRAMTFTGGISFTF